MSTKEIQRIVDSTTVGISESYRQAISSVIMEHYYQGVAQFSDWLRAEDSALTEREMDLRGDQLGFKRAVEAVLEKMKDR